MQPHGYIKITLREPAPARGAFALSLRTFEYSWNALYQTAAGLWVLINFPLALWPGYMIKGLELGGSGWFGLVHWDQDGLSARDLYTAYHVRRHVPLRTVRSVMYVSDTQLSAGAFSTVIGREPRTDWRSFFHCRPKLIKYYIIEEKNIILFVSCPGAESPEPAYIKQIQQDEYGWRTIKNMQIINIMRIWYKQH